MLSFFTIRRGSRGIVSIVETGALHSMVGSGIWSMSAEIREEEWKKEKKKLLT